MNNKTSVDYVQVDDEYQSRQRLCHSLSRDLAESLFSDPDGESRLAEMLCTGFQGFSTKSNHDLIEAIFEAGLEDRNLTDIEILSK